MRLQQRLQLKYFNHLSANELKQQVKRALGRSNHGRWVVEGGCGGSAWRTAAVMRLNADPGD